MPKPVTVTIPHELGRAEARKRIEDGISRMGHQFDGVKLTKAWDGDCLSFSAKAKFTGIFAAELRVKNAVIALSRKQVNTKGKGLARIVSATIKGFTTKTTNSIAPTNTSNTCT